MLGAAFEAYVSVRVQVKAGVRPRRALRELMLWQNELIPEVLLSAHGVDGRVAFVLAVWRFEEAVRRASTDRASDVIALTRGFVYGILASEAGALWGTIFEELQARQGEHAWRQ